MGIWSQENKILNGENRCCLLAERVAADGSCLQLKGVLEMGLVLMHAVSLRRTPTTSSAKFEANIPTKPWHPGKQVRRVSHRNLHDPTLEEQDRTSSDPSKLQPQPDSSTFPWYR